MTEITTPRGRLVGTTAAVDSRPVRAFRGVPYAVAARFAPPARVTSWTGARDATAFGPAAPQPVGGPLDGLVPGSFRGSTDEHACLTLNVWAPADAAKARPVLVWFPGGAFTIGASSQPAYDGARFCAEQDVVVVTCNYRLGALGFLDTRDAGGVANCGLRDAIAALEWVRDNIEAFGGDAERVTVFGESAGGGIVLHLAASPRARGLFHRAIVQSGAAVRLRERDRAAQLTEAVLKEVELTAAQLDRLQALPVAQLLAAVGPALKTIGPAPMPLFDRYPFGPVVDGDIVPRHPFDPDAPDISADIPLLIGDMKDEMASFLATDNKVWNRALTEQELRDRIVAVAVGHADQVIATYRRLHPGMNPAERLIATLTDSNFRTRSLIVAERKAMQTAPVYMYAFNWETPLFGGRLKAPHALDVPFTFDTLDFTNATDRSPAAHKLATTMAGVWAAFARSGRPEHPAIPAWPAYNQTERATMILDSECRVESDPGAATRLLWRAITAT